MTEQIELEGVSRGWHSWRLSTRVVLMALLLGVGAAVAGRAVWDVASGDQLVLVAGDMTGETLSMLLGLVACLCAAALGVAGFPLLVIGREAFTTAVTAILLSAVILAAGAGMLVTAFLALVHSDGRFATLDELGRPSGSQIVIEYSGSLYDPDWHFYVGGPFVYDRIPESLLTTAECAELSTAGRTTFENGEYLITTNEFGRDVITFTTAGFRNCDHDGVPELVLPDQ